ncbi:hypothetical protein ZIOFF_045529 [Zingiber officinale]|uniref:Uncharacterized protein n=1 Tax=Zingiber officinale TaxID=94328 RepID=A0A8J5FZC1_ZINOF|nr:hypothetical protein ZIOFF_045529 [Zingiber officinale]
MLDDEAREEKELDLTFPDVVTKYKTAVEIVNKALQLVVSQCKPKAKVVDLFEKGDSFIRELSSFPVSFDRPSTSDRFDLAPASSLRGIPTQGFAIAQMLFLSSRMGRRACSRMGMLDLSECGSECIELLLDDLAISSLCCSDMGCHIDGFIIVVAHTHVIQEGPVIGRAADVIDAANIAAEVALRLVRPGKKKDLVTPDSSSPSSGTCSSGPPPSAKDATCYMSSTQSSPVDQDDKDGSSPEGHVTEPAMETMKDKFLNPIKKQDKNRLTVHAIFNITQGKDVHQATSVVDETRMSTNRKVIVRSSYFKHKPSDVNSLHRPNDGATDGNENNDCIPGGYPVKKRKLSEDNENQPPILVMNQENMPSKNARTSFHHGEDNQVSCLNNNGAMVREGGKFGCDISHVNNYTTVAERSMGIFVALMSSFRYTQSSARASVLRAPLKDIQNSSSSARPNQHQKHTIVWISDMVDVNWSNRKTGYRKVGSSGGVPRSGGVSRSDTDDLGILTKGCGAALAVVGCLLGLWSNVGSRGIPTRGCGVNSTLWLMKSRQIGAMLHVMTDNMDSVVRREGEEVVGVQSAVQLVREEALSATGGVGLAAKPAVAETAWTQGKRERR